MKMTKIVPIALIFSYAISMMPGCGSPQQQVELSWPPPPDQAHIKFIEILKDEDYFPRPLWQRIFGGLLGADPAKRLAKPYGVVADATGAVYVTDTILGAVVVFDKTEQKIRTIGDSGQGRLAVPSGITANDSLLFVSDSKQRRVYVYTFSGELKRIMGNDTLFVTPAGICMDETMTKVYVVDSGKHCIHIFSIDGTYLSSFGHRGSDDGAFNFPTNICIRNGKIYIMDTMNFRVQVFDSTGIFISKFGSIGNRPGFFARPKGIAVDSNGNIYVSDAGFENFQIFNEQGQVLMYVGSAGINTGEFGLPAGIFIDRKDRLYVVEQSNSRVQVFQCLH